MFGITYETFFLSAVSLLIYISTGVVNINAEDSIKKLSSGNNCLVRILNQMSTKSRSLYNRLIGLPIIHAKPLLNLTTSTPHDINEFVSKYYKFINYTGNEAVYSNGYSVFYNSPSVTLSYKGKKVFNLPSTKRGADPTLDTWPMSNLTREQLLPSSGSIVLDIGSGKGALVDDLRKNNINAFGFDVYATPEQVRSGYFVPGIFPDTPFVAKLFDVIYARFSIFYYDTHHAMIHLEEINRILKDNGVLYIDGVSGNDIESVLNAVERSNLEVRRKKRDLATNSFESFYSLEVVKKTSN